MVVYLVEYLVEYLVVYLVGYLVVLKVSNIALHLEELKETNIVSYLVVHSGYSVEY